MFNTRVTILFCANNDPIDNSENSPESSENNQCWNSIIKINVCFLFPIESEALNGIEYGWHAVDL